MFEFNPNRLKENSYKYLKAKSKGYKEGDLPPFSVADADFYLPQIIQERLSDFMRERTFGYNAPDENYHQTVINWIKSRHNFEVKPEWIVSSIGVIPAISNVLNAFTKEHDAVCIMSPVYHVFYRIIHNLKRKLVVNPLMIDHEQNYTIDFELLERQFIEEDVKVMLLCSPHNPVGKVWSKKDLQTLSKLCQKHDILVISDEIHFDLILTGHEHTVYPSLSDEALNHTILCTAASKTFNLTGFKNSNIIIANQNLRDQYIETYEKMSLEIHMPNTLGLYATQVAYDACGAYVNDFLALIEMNYKLIQSFLDLHLPQIKASPLEGTYLLWLDFRGLKLEQEALIEVLENHGLYLSNGLDFGENGRGFMRMNIAATDEVIIKAMQQLKKAFVKEQIL